MKKKEHGIGVLCDNCEKTLFFISGPLSEELFNLIMNNIRYVDNTEILCPCL